MKSISRDVYMAEVGMNKSCKTVKNFAAKPYTNIMPCKVPWTGGKGQNAKLRCKSALPGVVRLLSIFYH